MKLHISRTQSQIFFISLEIDDISLVEFGIEL